MSKRAKIDFFYIPVAVPGQPPMFRADIPLRSGGRRVLAETRIRSFDGHYVLELKRGPLATHRPPKAVSIEPVGIIDQNLPSNSPALRNAAYKLFGLMKDIVTSTALREERGYSWPDPAGWMAYVR